MSSRAVFRVAPSRNGMMAAHTWRFWRSGDEFYGGVRKATHLSKLSFHRTGNWQLRIDSAMHRLPVTRHISSEWTHVISLQWMILPDSFHPNSTGHEEVLLIEVPVGYRLCLDLFVSRTTSLGELPDSNPGGLFVWDEKLRNGRRLAMQQTVVPWTDIEVLDALGIRHASSVTVERPPAERSHYAEIAWFTSRPSTGNVVKIVPHGPNEVQVKRTTSA